MSESGPVRHWLDDPPTVAAVLVSHNGARWLPKVLLSFSQMFHAPDVWRAVDVESTDGSAELVRESFGEKRVVRAPRGTGFGEAVRLAVETMPRTDWLWLLHDDASVLPGTLAGLLDVGTSAGDIGIVGPKVREWPSLKRLLEVGVTVTGSGSRVTGLETGEPDAGQHDRPRDVLAVGTAGMLIRRDLWDTLDGFDRDLPLAFDDVDLGWRAARAGYRVSTAPAGVVFHAEATRRGVRKRLRSDPAPWDRRRAAIWTQLANVGPLRFLWQYPRLLVAGLARVIGLVLAKDPDAARQELRAVRAAYAHPIRLLRARRRRSRAARRGHGSVRPLLAPWTHAVQHGYDVVRDAAVSVVRPEAVQSVGRRSNVLDQAPEEAVDLDDGPSWLTRHPWLAMVAAVTVLALIASRDVVGGFLRGIGGGALPPSPDSAWGWWQLLVGAERAPGLVDSVPPAYLVPLSMAATPVWFRPDLVIAITMVLAVPLAALTAHRFGRSLSDRRTARILWALSYAALVAAVGAVPQGRLGTVAALVVAPVAANQAWRLAEHPDVRTAVRLGLAIAVAGAFAPVALVIAAGGLALLWYLEGAWVGRHLAYAALTPALLLGPWLWVRGLPWRWWWEAGAATSASETLVDIVAGRAGGVAAPPWLSVPVLIAAVVALWPQRTRLAVRACWMFGLLNLAVALLGHLMLFAGPSGRVDLSPWVGVPAVLWVASLLTAVLLAVPALDDRPRTVGRVVVVAALVLPVGVGGWWVARGQADPLTDDSLAAVPAFLADRPGQTLLIEPVDDGTVRVDLIRGDGDRLGEEAFDGGRDQADAVVDATQRLLGRPTDEDVDVLAAAGVSAIYLTDAESDPTLAQRIDGSALVEQTGSDRPGARAWNLVTAPELRTASVPWWRRALSALQVLAWIVVIVAVLPVRRRVVADDAGDDAADEPRTELVAVPMPADTTGVARGAS